MLAISGIDIYRVVSASPGEGNGTPLQYSCLENPMDRGAWWAAIHGVAKSRTRLSAFTFTFPFHALEKEMATHSSVLAWRIPGMGEPGGLSSLGSHRVRHDWSDLAAAVHIFELLLILSQDSRYVKQLKKMNNVNDHMLVNMIKKSASFLNMKLKISKNLG